MDQQAPVGVYLLWHVYEATEGKQDSKLIGVYATHELLKEAAARAEKLPGFREHAYGFIMEYYELNRDHWTEGFHAPTE